MEKQLLMVCLPNNEEVFCLRQGEAKVLYEQVQDYLKYGITFKEGDTIFDVGANIGLFSLMANDLCGGKANIFAFEPIPEIFKVLQSNASKFNLTKIKAFQLGLGNHSRLVDFSYYPNATAISSCYPDCSGKEKQMFVNTLKENTQKLPLPFNLIGLLPEPFISFFSARIVDFAYKEKKVKSKIKTISEIITEQSIEQIDLLKIDVEKAEFDVLEGINEKDWSIIQQIVIEVHNLNNRLDQVVGLLASKGFVQIDQEQDPFFKHLDIYSVYASR